jgi:hypothetical protein
MFLYFYELYKRCRNKRIYTQEYFEFLTRSSNIDELNKGKEYCSNINLNQCLELALETKNKSVCEFFIKQGATNLKESLITVSKNNIYDLVELLINNGGPTATAIRYSTSPNILRMIYRYEQKCEIIN